MSIQKPPGENLPAVFLCLNGLQQGRLLRSGSTMYTRKKGCILTKKESDANAPPPIIIYKITSVLFEPVYGRRDHPARKR